MPEIFGFKVEAPRLPSWNEIRSTVTHTAQTATQLGRSALSHARNLGSQGVDLGRRAIADPEGTVRRLAASARTGIHHAETAAQNGIRDGVMWTGRQIHAGANVARGAVHGNSTVAQVTRGLITHTENQTRFTVGVAGGLAKEAVGLVGTAGTLGTYATELQYSRSARAELGNAISSGVSRGSVAVADYARSVAANPSRVAGDVRGAATATWNAGSGFVEGQVRRHEEAFRRGEGFETIGMTTGQVASYFIPVGAGAKAASTGVRGAEAIAIGGTRTLAREGAELTIASARATGNPAAISRGLGELNTRQANVLARLDVYGSRATVAKTFSHNDLAALTAATGNEFAMFTTGGRRMIMRGDAASVPITPAIGESLANQGWRFSAHTHPGVSPSVLRASEGDMAVLKAMGGERSAILNSRGDRVLFTPQGNSFEGWKPW